MYVENVAPARQSASTVTANLRSLLAQSTEILVAPGASDELSARADTGLLSLEQLASHNRPLEDFLGYKDAPGRNR